MRSSRRGAAARISGLLSVLALLAGAGRAGAQTANAALVRALDYEQNGRYREAAQAYREALTPEQTIPALLGLERAYAELGMSDSLLPLLDSLIRARPREPMFRSAQLRTLRSARRQDALRAAFERWVRDVPRDATPYREYARMLIQDGLVASADSVLLRAQRDLSGGRDVALEVAQLRSAMGLWGPAASAWRTAVGDAAYLESAAVYALTPAPAKERQAIRDALGGVPAAVPARRVLALLELGWGSPRDAWQALRDLPPDSAAAAAWIAFADRAETSESWSVARDALAAALAWRSSPQLAVRAATAALNAGDAAGALTLVRAAIPSTRADSARIARALTPLLVRAYGQLGRATEAERTVSAFAPWLGPNDRRGLARAVAWGWVRSGDIARARAALAASGESDETTTGWLALYEGDLGAAREALRSSLDPSPDAVTAMALLSRTKADSSPAVGRAFLTLARGDSAQAAAAFADAARTLPDAAPLLLATAAQIYSGLGAAEKALPLWRTIVEQYEHAPEAAEADLEWARLLRRRGDTAGAIAQLEHLILTYPESALVPQARRELERARSGIPST